MQEPSDASRHLPLVREARIHFLILPLFLAPLFKGAVAFMRLRVFRHILFVYNLIIIVVI